MCKTITNIQITSLISLDYKFFKAPGLPVFLAGEKEKPSATNRWADDKI